MTKNITLSADERLIERARERARQQQTSLNAAFREWLERFAAQGDAHDRYAQLMNELSDVSSAGPYTRDEMNER